MDEPYDWELNWENMQKPSARASSQPPRKSHTTAVKDVLVVGFGIVISVL